jgi:hypothetical protein
MAWQRDVNIIWVTAIVSKGTRMNGRLFCGGIFLWDWNFWFTSSFPLKRNCGSKASSEEGSYTVHSTYPNEHNGRQQWGRRSERDDIVPAACGPAIVGRVRHSLTHSTAPRNNEQQLCRVIARKKSRAGV